MRDQRLRNRHDRAEADVTGGAGGQRADIAACQLDVPQDFAAPCGHHLADAGQLDRVADPSRDRDAERFFDFADLF